jgi:stage II sporulation protein D
VKHLWLCVLLLAAFPALARGDVRVLLFQTQTLQTISVSSDAGFRILDLKTRALVLAGKPGEKIEIAAAGISLRVQGGLIRKVSGPLLLEAGGPVGVFFISTPGTPRRPYPGLLEIRNLGLSLRVINQAPANEYLASAVANEIPPAWPAEALKAQAVLARTYVARNRGRHTTMGADLCDLAHCQVYKGQTADPRVRAAVSATDGLILTYRGGPLDAVYHSSCGGKTAAAQDVWGQSNNTPYLAGVSDAGPHGDYCQASPDHAWRFDLSGEQLLKQLKANGVSLPAPLSEIRTTLAPQSGRVAQVQLDCQDGSAQTLTGENFYLAWGRGGHWLQLKSTWFTVEKQGGTFRFQGQGSGHGVGLCQWGARGRALAGDAYQEILHDYFPGAGLEPEPGTAKTP